MKVVFAIAHFQRSCESLMASRLLSNQGQVRSHHGVCAINRVVLRDASAALPHPLEALQEQRGRLSREHPQS